MSVLVPDLMVYEYVCSGLYVVSNNKVCDDLYSSTISQHMSGKDWEAESMRLVRSWADLNVESFNITYKDRGGWLHPKVTMFFDIRAVQLLKYVECIYYNIEPSTIKTKRALNNQEIADIKLLDSWKVEITAAIVHQLKEYDLAKWSQPPQVKISANT